MPRLESIFATEIGELNSDTATIKTYGQLELMQLAIRIAIGAEQ